MRHTLLDWSVAGAALFGGVWAAPRASGQESPVTKVEVRFARGKSSAVYEDAVIRGERTIYLLRARAGQRMKVRITSLEKNAVFDVEDPKGKMVPRAQELTQWEGKLRLTGKYRIWVGGTRGNASYKITISVR